MWSWSGEVSGWSDVAKMESLVKEVAGRCGMREVDVILRCGAGQCGGGGGGSGGVEGVEEVCGVRSEPVGD